MIDKKIIAAYNLTREINDKTILCHAPFTSINFQQNGDGNACCYNRTHILGTFPEHTIREMWFGEKANELRGYILNNDLGGGCHICQKQLQSHNFSNCKAKGYDLYAEPRLKRYFKKIVYGKKIVDFPKVMEFELSNTCNLECIMCSGYFSSSIRKNREGKSPLANPYNDEFIRQLEEFIPHLKEARFLGGEPFLIDIYYEIWEMILRINPSIKISITTNGSVLNKRAISLLNKLNCSIIISVDSIVKVTYEKIRVNANYETLIKNLEWFYDYTRKKNTFMSLAVCPMVENWKEISELMRFCNSKEISIFFNTVLFPKEQALRNCNSATLEEIYLFYTSFISERNTEIQKLNATSFSDLTNQVKAWQVEKAQYEIEKSKQIIKSQNYLQELLKNDIISQVQKGILKRLLELEDYQNRKQEVGFNYEPFFFDLDYLESPVELFSPIINELGHEKFLNEYLNALSLIAEQRLNKEELILLKNNFEFILQLLPQHDIFNKMVEAITKAEAKEIFDIVSKASENEIKKMLLEYEKNLLKFDPEVR
jgi:MoaA/NifB/PqqE/SkfB family radical SAM enzyme